MSGVHLDLDLDLAPARRQRTVRSPVVTEWKLQGRSMVRIHRTREGFLMRFPQVADFHISRDGSHVSTRPAPGVEAPSLHSVFLSQVLPVALSRRGRLVFHASAVEVDGCAIAFMGASGRGKSTLAAAFATAGLRFLTDDGLFVEVASGAATVVPGHSSLRLWSDSAEALLGPEPGVEDGKARILSGDRIAHCGAPRPLRRIYLLGDVDDAGIRIRPLAGAPAFTALAGHSFLLADGDARLLEGHFEGLAALAGQGLCASLRYPRSYARLPDVRAAVLADLPGPRE